MGITVICLVVVGIVLVAVSFFIKNEPALEKISIDPEAEAAATKEKCELMYHTVEGKMMELQGQVENALEHYLENQIDWTKDALNAEANEKMMAIDEYSKVVMEEIKSVHKEAMFLYNMLNDKEKAVKALMSERMVQPQMQSITVNQQSQLWTEGKRLDQVQQQFADTTFGELDPKPTVMHPMKQEENRVNRQIQAKSISSIDEDLERIIRELQELTPELETEQDGTYPMPLVENPKEIMDNQNRLILNYYQQGMSYTEIAKHMQLGTGEVKLVIDLFKSGIDK